MPTSAPPLQPSQQPTVASVQWLQSPPQALEQEEFGTDTSASSFAAIPGKKNNLAVTGEKVAPRNRTFREFV